MLVIFLFFIFSLCLCLFSIISTLFMWITFFLLAKNAADIILTAPVIIFILILLSKLLFLSQIGNGEGQPIPHLRVLVPPNLWCEHLSKEPPIAGYCSTNTTVLTPTPLPVPFWGNRGKCKELWIWSSRSW